MTAFLDQAFDQIRLNRTIQYLFLAGITCLALVLRLYKLGAWSFWIDEIFTINAAQFVWDWPLERMPLNLLLIHYALNWFGIGEWSARIVPALIGTVSIPILFFPVRRLFGPITAVITAILIATAPWHIFWSQNARFYALLMLFYNIGLLYTLIALEEKRPLFLVIGTFFFLLALREKFTAIFFVPVLGSYFLFLLILPFERPRWLKWQTIFILASPIILFVFYDIYSYIFRDYSQIRSLLVTFWGRSIDDPFRLFSFFTFNITVPVLVLAVFGGLHLMAQKKRSGLYLTLGAVVPLLVTLILTTFTFVKDRYIFTSLISWLILTAVTIDAFWCLLPHVTPGGRLSPRPSDWRAEL
jgi:4-amino-4-deoxy-L-arabinose transferase-like glycosyltransferase